MKQYAKGLLSQVRQPIFLRQDGWIWLLVLLLTQFYTSFSACKSVSVSISWLIARYTFSNYSFIPAFASSTEDYAQ